MGRFSSGYGNLSRNDINRLSYATANSIPNAKQISEKVRNDTIVR